MGKQKVLLIAGYGFLLGAVVTFWFMMMGFRLVEQRYRTIADQNILANRAMVMRELVNADSTLSATRGIGRLKNLRRSLKAEIAAISRMLLAYDTVLGLPAVPGAPPGTRAATRTAE